MRSVTIDINLVECRVDTYVLKSFKSISRSRIQVTWHMDFGYTAQYTPTNS